MTGETSDCQLLQPGCFSLSKQPQAQEFKILLLIFAPLSHQNLELQEQIYSA